MYSMLGVYPVSSSPLPPRGTDRCLSALLKVSEIEAVTGAGAARGGSDPCAQAEVARLLRGDLLLGMEESVSL